MAGSLARTEATGYGLIYFVKEMIGNRRHQPERGRRWWFPAPETWPSTPPKRGASPWAPKVVAMSATPTAGYTTRDGIDLAAVKEIKEGQARPYPRVSGIRPPNAEYHEGKGIWSIPCDVALPCATQNELNEEDAKIRW